MNHPSPQSREEMENEVLVSIRGVALDMVQAIDTGDKSALEIHHEFLEAQWRRRCTILTAKRLPIQKL